MSNFEEACALSCEEWVNSLPDDVHFDFSPKFEKEMSILIDKMRNDKYHRFTKKTMTTLIIAAIILSFATTVFAVPSTRDYITKKFKDHFLYTVTDIDEVEAVNNLVIDDIPYGFIKTDEDHSEINIYEKYSNEDLWFTVFKSPIDSFINYDNSEQEVLTIDNIEYVVYHNDLTTGIIWNNSFYTYRIIGNIEKEKLIEIASKTE